MNSYEIQMWARELGAQVTVDGIVGPKTRRAVASLLKVAGHNSYKDALIAFEQFAFRTIGGLSTGPIDGIAGPATAKARKHWMRGPWRNQILNSVASDSRMPKTLNSWPKYSELEEFFGPAGSNLVQVTMPFPLRLSWQPNKKVQRITCHAKVADSLVRVQQNILDAYGRYDVVKLRLDVWGGCYAARPMRGSTRLSTHAYGIAWDTDPVNNALRANRTQAHLARPEYEAFWKAWTDEGWLSLGKARDFDWMHVQACRL